MDNEGQKLAKVLSYYNMLDNANLSDKFKVICPFHEDLKPSMLVDLVKGYFYCFGCDKKGDALDFVANIEKGNSLYNCIALHKILKSKRKSKIKINYSKVQDNKELLDDAKFYFYTLPKTKWNVMPNNYMFERGFTPKILKRNDVRINENSTYGVIAPILDMGEFKGYVCRATTESDRKYLYNKGFSRSNTLVGNYNKPWVVITEGYMDWLKLQQYGITNSVAILGWKITNQQIVKLQKYTDCVISALDNTPSGRKGTKFLKEYFHVVRFQFSENVKDIGEMDEFEFSKCWSDTIEKINK
jgi:DNA primase